MTNKEAFLLGFLAKCAEEGLTPEEVEQRAMHKVAMMKVAILGAAMNAATSAVKGVAGTGKDIVGAGLSTAKDVAGGVANVALPLLVAGPPIAGAGVGYAMSQLEDDNFEVDDAKKDEELAEWNNAIQQLRTLRRLQSGE